MTDDGDERPVANIEASDAVQCKWKTKPDVQA